MKVEKRQIDDLNIELTLNVEGADYAEIERKRLADCRRKADFKGFRKGMAPTSLVKRIYGDQILGDSVNQVVSAELQKFVEENNLNILGEPLSSESQPAIDWTDGGDFTFIFDIALRPEVNVDVVKEDVVNKYSITVAAKDKADMIANLKKYYEEKKDGEAKTDEEIEKEVTDRLTNQYKNESDWRLSQDIRNFYVEKSGVKLPEDFLKRWLLAANEGKVSKEDVEKEFPRFIEDFRWQLVRGSLMKKFELKVEQADIEEAAKAYVTYQYAMYGLANVPEDMVKEALGNVLSDRNQVERLIEQVEDQKVMAKIKETLTIKSKKISAEKFRELK